MNETSGKFWCLLVVAGIGVALMVKAILMRLAFAIIIGATIGASAAHATHPRVIRSHVQHVQVVEPVLAAQYVAVPYSLPAYSVGMQQQLADPAVLERIAVALEKIANRGNGELGELPPEPEYVGLVRTNCAACHGITPKGNKLSFFDTAGRFKEPTPEVLGAMLQSIASGAMPKGGKMEAADRLRLIAGLTSAPPEAAAMPKAK